MNVSARQLTHSILINGLNKQKTQLEMNNHFYLYGLVIMSLLPIAPIVTLPNSLSSCFK